METCDDDAIADPDIAVINNIKITPILTNYSDAN